LVSARTVIRQAEPLAKRTTLRVGGPADIYVEPASENDLATVVRTCADQQWSATLLWRGGQAQSRGNGGQAVWHCRL
jgi:UDP-N-acetylenolpyruvoylglucosamine reductase